MSSFGGVWPQVLGDAITVARSVLRELDGPEIPSSLRRVFAYSGGKLPPPLATSLLAEMDRNEWFRGKVVEQWEGDDASPSGLFLTRPDGWWADVALAAGSAVDGKDESRIDGLVRRLEKTEAKRSAAAQKATEYKRKLADAQQRTKELVSEAKESVARGFADDAAQLTAATAEVDRLTNTVTDLEQQHGELRDAFMAIRARLAKARKARLSDPGDEATRRSFATDPIKLARLLDLQKASFGRSSGEAKTSPDQSESPLALSAGVRPDSSDAIRWLSDLEEAVVVVVDGYNAQFHINPADFTSGAARRQLVEALRRLRAAATVRHRVVVVYDSTLPGERVARTSVSGVEVRFAEKDRIADEEIVAMVEHLDRVVVISSDREVREGAGDGGAVVLWSEALSDWLQRD